MQWYRCVLISVDATHIQSVYVAYNKDCQCNYDGCYLLKLNYLLKGSAVEQRGAQDILHMIAQLIALTLFSKQLKLHGQV